MHLATAPATRATAHPSRRAPLAERRVRPAQPRDRFTFSAHAQSDHMRGWVAYTLAMALPADASADFRAGYAEAREMAIDQLTGQESAT